MKCNIVIKTKSATGQEEEEGVGGEVLNRKAAAPAAFLFKIVNHVRVIKMGERES